MEKKVIISDLTLSAAEGVAETKAKRFWENRMKPYEKVRFLAGHFDRFIEYNHEYVQEGPIQIAVSATKDVGAYQIGPDEYMEDVLVSRMPLRGAKYFVALLGEARNCASSHRRFQRCLYANTFYLHIDGKGVIHLDRLLDNNDWLFADRVDRALEITVERLGGKMSEAGKTAVVRFFLRRNQRFRPGRILYCQRRQRTSDYLHAQFRNNFAGT